MRGVGYFRDVLACREQTHPDDAMLVDIQSSVSYTWSQYAARVRRMSRFLTEVLGIVKRDRVAFLSENSVYMLDAFFATYDTGAILDVLNYRLFAGELAQMAERETPRVVFYKQQWREKAIAVRDRLNGECILVVMDSDCDECADYSYRDIESCDSSRLESGVVVLADDPQMLIHTGGTTGLPKAGILTYQNVFLNAVSETIQWGIGSRDCAYAGMPFYHTAGWNVNMLSTLLVGGRVILSGEFTASAFLNAVQKHKASLFMGADAMFRAIAAHPDFADANLSSLEWVMGGGGPVSQSTMVPYWNKGVKFFVGYGMTESGPNNIGPDVRMSFEESKEKPCSVGKPLVFTQVKIVREDGEEARVGERGEICLRGPLTFGGYWGQEEETRKVIVDGWVKTGDIGYRDEDGDISICGRRKNMFISGGENIFPIEIERCLEGHPAVAEACVFGIPDEKWGEVGKAIVVLRSGMDLEKNALVSWMRSRLSTIKQPKYIEFVDSIPVNGAGKRDMAAIYRLYS